MGNSTSRQELTDSPASDSMASVLDQIWEANTNVTDTPGMIYALACMEHKFAAQTRCLPDEKGREMARKGLAHIQEAYQAFRGAGDLGMEAGCHYFWAELILDHAASISDFKRLAPDAVSHYSMAEDLMDLIRQGIGESPAAFDDWRAKRGFRDDQDKERTPNNAVSCLILSDRLVDAWEWIQRWKAASLAETVGLRAIRGPVSVTGVWWKEMHADPDGYRMLQEFDNLGAKLVQGSYDGHISLMEAQMAYNRQLVQLRQHGSMRTLLSLRGQLPISKPDFDDWLEASMEDGITSMANVDWVHLGSSIVVVVSRPRGAIEYEDLGDYNDIMGVLDDLGRLPEGDIKSKSPVKIFGQYEQLIAPLQRYTRPGELLILAPMENMHLLPLHAFRLNGEPLIKRNPVLYSYGASLMAICAMRRRQAATGYQHGKAVVFGNPENDWTRRKLAESMDESSRAVANELSTGTEYISRKHGVDKSTFMEAAKGAAILHYHGHAEYCHGSATDAGLKLAHGEMLKPEDMSQLELQEGAHVTLIACQSDRQDMAFGNEPIGMVPALFVAGACSVLATLWKVPSSVGQAFSESFYRHGLGMPARRRVAGRVHLARAVQRATLDVLDRYGKASANWAPFVLRGFHEF